MRRYRNHAVILATSFSVLVAEIAYTRLVSFKLYYYYVYLVIGLAMLGLGAGSVLVAVSLRLRRASTEAILLAALGLGAVSTVLGYLAVAYMQIDTLSVWRYGSVASFASFGLIAAMCICVFACFLGPGVVLATLFSRKTEEVGGLYAADLLGAAAGCAAVVFAVWKLGAPASIMLSGAVLAMAALVIGVKRGRRTIFLVSVVLAGTALLVAVPGLLPTQRLDSSKYFVKPPQPDVAHGWGPIFRVDAAPAPHDSAVINLYHDGILGAAILKWNGKRTSLSADDFPFDPRSIPFSVLGSPPDREAVIGAAGGHEVLTSLYYGAKHVDAVELNPVTVSMVRTTFSAFDGHLAENPSVDYIVGDGRSFIARSRQHDQLIWYPAPDSYAATNSALAGAYVLSESYLYTTEALVSDLRHLSPHGLFVAQFGEDTNIHDLRTTRFVATVRAALSQASISDPSRHIMVAITTTKFLGIPLSTILVGRSAFTPAQVGAFLAATRRVPGTQVLAAPGQVVKANPVQRVVTLPERDLASFYSSFPFDVTPTTDNGPYFWHFARFGSVLASFFQPLSSLDREDAVGERVLVLLLAVASLIAALILLVPFVKLRKQWARIPHKGTSVLYFAAIGFGFMFFEITMMQFLNLFLGYPTYALIVTLLSLLVFTGTGAFVSARFNRPGRVVAFAGVFLVPLFAFYLWGLHPVTDAALGAPFGLRVMLTVVMIAPAGICFGLFMPLGLRRVSAVAPGDDGPIAVAWAWGVNAFASVVASVLATILSMDLGFEVVLGLALAFYVVAAAALYRTKESGRNRVVESA